MCVKVLNTASKIVYCSVLTEDSIDACVRQILRDKPIRETPDEVARKVVTSETGQFKKVSVRKLSTRTPQPVEDSAVRGSLVA